MMESEADLRRNSCDPLFWVVIDQKTAPVLTGHGEPESQEQAHSPVSFVWTMTPKTMSTSGHT